MNWQSKTVAIWEEWRSGKYRAYKVHFYGDWILEHDEKQTLGYFKDLQSLMAYAGVYASYNP